MNLFKKLITVAVAAAAIGSVIPEAYAMKENPSCGVLWSEDFETGSINDAIGADKLLYMQNSAQSSKISITEGAKNHNKYLTIKSDADNTNGCVDVQINTKNGLLAKDKAIIEMKLNSPDANGAFPQLMLVENNSKIGTGYPVKLTSKGVTLWDVTDGTAAAATYTYKADKWYDVKIVFDKANKTITTSIIGGDNSVTSTISAGWGDNVQIRFQVALGATLNIDDVVIKDGFYDFESIMNNDFNHAEATSYDTKVVDNIFSKINSNCTPKAVYDADYNNTYINVSDTDASKGLIVFTTNSLIYCTEGKPVVMECDFRIKDNTAFNYCVRSNNGGSAPVIFSISANKVTVNGKTANITSGEWHNIRATMTPASGKITASILLDGAWIGNSSVTCDISKGVRFDIRAVSGSAGYDFDNYKIYKPASPVIKTDVAGQNDVKIKTPVVLYSNNDINYSSLARMTITADGEQVSYSRVPNVANKTLQLIPDGGLQPSTTYVITTAANGLKDMFDQYYNTTITFTTETLDPVCASFDYTIDGLHVDEGRFTTGNMKLSFNVVSNTSAGADLTAFVAAFDKDNRLSAVELANAAVEGQGEKNTSCNITIGENVKTVKIMVWDKYLRPFMNAERLIPYSYEEIESLTCYYPEYTNKAVTFSYDDGIQGSDVQLVQLFNEYGIKGTFNLVGNFIPTEAEALSGYVAMYDGHEVSNHTMTHPKINTDTSITLEDASNDIIAGRDLISQKFGDKFDSNKWGFVWPYARPESRGTEFLTSLEQSIENAGAVYIRPVSTTGGFDLPENWFLWEPTCKDAYLKDGQNYDYMTPLTNEFIADDTQGLRLLYIWGHSSDLSSKKYGAGYEELEAVLKKLTADDVNIWSATNMEIYDYVNAVRGLRISDDKTKVINDSDVAVYATINGIKTVVPARGYSAL